MRCGTVVSVVKGTEKTVETGREGASRDRSNRQPPEPVVPTAAPAPSGVGAQLLCNGLGNREGRAESAPSGGSQRARRAPAAERDANTAARTDRVSRAVHPGRPVDAFRKGPHQRWQMRTERCASGTEPVDRRPTAVGAQPHRLSGATGRAITGDGATRRSRQDQTRRFDTGGFRVGAGAFRGKLRPRVGGQGAATARVAAVAFYRAPADQQGALTPLGAERVVCGERGPRQGGVDAEPVGGGVARAGQPAERDGASEHQWRGQQSGRVARAGAGAGAIHCDRVSGAASARADDHRRARRQRRAGGVSTVAGDARAGTGGVGAGGVSGGGAAAGVEHGHER
eukprot:ctg_2790.g393